LSADDVWIATDGGVVRWDGKNLNTNGVPQALRNVRALSLLEDQESDLWVGTASGLSRVRVRGGAGAPGGEELRGSPATALFQDREGNIWVGSNAGIERLRESVFLTYDRSLGLPSEKNGPIYIDPLGRTWFAPLDGGLYWLEQGRVGQVTAGGLAGEVVYSISGSADEIWAGLRNRGLARIRFSDSAPQRFLVDTFTEHDGLARGAVFAVHQARDRSLWAGTLDQGVSRFKDGHFTTFTLADGLASNSVSAILETSRGDLWLATPAGLSRFSGGKWQTYRAADGLPSNSVNCLFEDSSGVLWIGSAAGLAFFDSNRFHAPEGQPEVLRQQVLGIGEDRNGFLWITTSGHVLQASRAHLLQGPLSPSDVREYGLADGLRGMEGVRRSRSLVADAQGRIWLSTNGGISVIDPALLRVAAPVTARLQSIFADGASIGLQANTRIPPGRRRISFDYSGISLAAPGRVRFRYKLEGFDRDWSPPVAGREVAYTNLSPGAYTFHLMASGGDDGWSGPEATTSIVVDPLFWQTWWFRTLSGLALLGTAALAYRLRMRQLAGHLTLRFEERLAERSRIARELHDTLLQGLLSASMQLHVADDRLPDDSPAKPLLGRVLQLMSQVIDEGRNAVRGLRSHTVPACELEQAFSRVPDELAIRREQGFRVIVEGAPRPLNALIRDEAYRIGREALVNAFRHSQAGHIEIELEYARDRMRIMVRDDGIGIVAPKQQPASGGHWGLTGMRERAETIGARLSVRSRSHAGTEVELSIPAMIAFDVHAGEKRARWFSRARRDGGRQQSGRGMGSGK
jgi:signal transduction histidine kinase